MAIKSNPADAVNRWKAGVAAAGGRYTAGVQNTTDWAGAATSPAATQARDDALRKAMVDGTINAGIQRVGTQGWKNATVAKAANWQTGVNSPVAQQKAQAGFTRLFGYLQAAESAISAMPRGTTEENIARFGTWAREMHNQAQQGKNR